MIRLTPRLTGPCRPRVASLLLYLFGVLAVWLGALSPAPGIAQDGLPVVKAGVTLEQERFQTYVVMYALLDLGFRVQPESIDTYAMLHERVASGELSFVANHWAPLHEPLLAQGSTSLAPTGRLVIQAMQGYLVDRHSAATHGITNLKDLADPATAALFDVTGDGKADLVGCDPTWRCALVIEHQLNAFGLTDTVNHLQDNYDTRMLDATERVRARKPVLFYGWSPYWVTSKLDPDEDVQWLDVPFSSLPPPRERVSTERPDGSNPGFVINDMRIVANPGFLEAAPQAAELFRQVRIPLEDVAEQNLLMQLGENSLPDIRRHAKQWIANNRGKYDAWLTAARRK